MSDRHEGGTTSLEEVLTSRAFARPRPAAGAHAAAGAGSVEEHVVTERVDAAPGPVAPRLFVPAEDRGTDGQLEEVFLSAHFGRPLTLVRSAPAAGSVVVPFPTLAQREHTGYRAVAAVSGITAAAIVLAGVSSGPGHQRPPDFAAQAPRFTSLVPSGGTGGAASGSSPSTAVPGAAGTAPTATLADTDASSQTSAVTAGETLRSDNTSNSAATGGGGPGPGVSTIPAPSPPAVGGNPVAPVATALGNTVATVSASVTTATAQVASSLPAVATVTRAFTGVSANVVGATQAMSSTTP